MPNFVASYSLPSVTTAVTLCLLAKVGIPAGLPHCFLPGSETPSFFSPTPSFLSSVGGGSGATTAGVGVTAAPAAAAALC